MREFKFGIPRDIVEQSAIAKILSDLDSKIELNQQVNKTLEAIGQAIFKYWFINFEFPNENGKPYKSSGGEIIERELGKIPKGWNIGKLGEIGRIHPFGAYYRFAGAFLSHNSPMILDPDIMINAYEEKMIRDAEKLVLSYYSKLTAILNKYPSQWVDGICSELSIDTKGKKNIKSQIIAEKLKKDMPLIFASLPEKSKEVLKIILNNG